MLRQLISELESLSNPRQAENLQRFFKTGKEEYGEGDVFLGLNSKQIQDIAKKYYGLSFIDIKTLLDSKMHEHRMCALRILVSKYKKAKKDLFKKRQIFDFYLKNTKRINNWDLVDLSVPNIVGDFLLDKPRKILYKLAKSENLWERRISIVSTFTFIRKNQFEDALKISEILLDNKHDLIHKAVGWMLREVGKKDEKVLENFLKQHYNKMPRTTLRYSIERFEEEKRKKYLRGEI